MKLRLVVLLIVLVALLAAGAVAVARHQAAHVTPVHHFALGSLDGWNDGQ